MLVSPIFSQQENRYFALARITNGDTLLVVPLKEVQIYGFKPPKNNWQARRLTKLIYNVKKVYPYAKIAGIKLMEYNDTLTKIESKRKRRKFMKQIEDEIENEFGQDLRKLTISQGKILIKLIYRETDNTSYEILQELRGKFIAFFWQALARIFGYDLKIKYEPEHRDRRIETIVKMIETGQI